MSSPFVRRRRLAAELRALREEHGVTAARLADLLKVSRMKISRLENAHIRPDLAEIMKILEILNVTAEKQKEVIAVARGAAERGWWESYGEGMSPHQRLLADVESGATAIYEYSQSIPSVLQSRDYARFAIEMTQAAGDAFSVPGRTLEAHLCRKRRFLAPEGPRYEVVIDEIAVRRPDAPHQVMVGQFRHMIEIAMQYPRVTLHILPLTADFTGHLLPKSAFSIYNFPDPGDPKTTLVETLCTDIVHSKAQDVARYAKRYDSIREVSLSSTDSLALIADLSEDSLNGKDRGVEA